MARRTIKNRMKNFIFQSKVNIVLFTLSTIVICVFIVAALLQDKGTFTIMTPRDDMIVLGLKLSDEQKFDRPRGELIAKPVKNMWNITQSDIPSNVDSVDGEHNGENYLAYTFYAKNEGEGNIKYEASINITEMHLEIDEAMRVKVYVNGVPTVYAKAMKSNRDKPEPSTTAFIAKTRIVRFGSKNLDIGKIDKYTVVVWLEGEDPDCVNSILGGSVKLSMQFDASAQTIKKV